MSGGHRVEDGWAAGKTPCTCTPAPGESRAATDREVRPGDDGDATGRGRTPCTREKGPPARPGPGQRSLYARQDPMHLYASPSGEGGATPDRRVRPGDDGDATGRGRTPCTREANHHSGRDRGGGQDPMHLYASPSEEGGATPDRRVRPGDDGDTTCRGRTPYTREANHHPGRDLVRDRCTHGKTPCTCTPPPGEGGTAPDRRVRPGDDGDATDRGRTPCTREKGHRPGRDLVWDSCTLGKTPCTCTQAGFAGPRRLPGATSSSRAPAGPSTAGTPG
jgi:hypothetical protein